MTWKETPVLVEEEEVSSNSSDSSDSSTEEDDTFFLWSMSSSPSAEEKGQDGRGRSGSSSRRFGNGGGGCGETAAGKEAEPTGAGMATRREVRFGRVVVREFPPTIGDSPAVSRGVPVALHYDSLNCYFGRRTTEYACVDDWEGSGCSGYSGGGRRKNASTRRLLLSADERRNMLLRHGHGEAAIESAILECERHRKKKNKKKGIKKIIRRVATGGGGGGGDRRAREKEIERSLRTDGIVSDVKTGGDVDKHRGKSRSSRRGSPIFAAKSSGSDGAPKPGTRRSSSSASPPGIVTGKGSGEDYCSYSGVSGDTDSKQRRRRRRRPDHRRSSSSFGTANAAGHDDGRQEQGGKQRRRLSSLFSSHSSVDKAPKPGKRHSSIVARQEPEEHGQQLHGGLMAVLARGGSGDTPPKPGRRRMSSLSHEEGILSSSSPVSANGPSSAGAFDARTPDGDGPGERAIALQEGAPAKERRGRSRVSLVFSVGGSSRQPKTTSSFDAVPRPAARRSSTRLAGSSPFASSAELSDPNSDGIENDDNVNGMRYSFEEQSGEGASAADVPARRQPSWAFPSTDSTASIFTDDGIDFDVGGGWRAASTGTGAVMQGPPHGSGRIALSRSLPPMPIGSTPAPQESIFQLNGKVPPSRAMERFHSAPVKLESPPATGGAQLSSSWRHQQRPRRRRRPRQHSSIFGLPAIRPEEDVLMCRHENETTEPLQKYASSNTSHEQLSEVEGGRGNHTPITRSRSEDSYFDAQSVIIAKPACPVSKSPVAGKSSLSRQRPLFWTFSSETSGMSSSKTFRHRDEVPLQLERPYANHVVGEVMLPPFRRKSQRRSWIFGGAARLKIRSRSLDDIKSIQAQRSQSFELPRGTKDVNDSMLSMTFPVGVGNESKQRAESVRNPFAASITLPVNRSKEERQKHSSRSVPCLNEGYFSKQNIDTLTSLSAEFDLSFDRTIPVSFPVHCQSGAREKWFR